jgi:quinoprotein glucose dehydrogenase
MPPPGYTDARYEEGQAGQPFSIQLGGGMGGAPGAPKLTEEQSKLAAIIAETGSAKPATPAIRTSVEGLPLVKPPYGTITAINLDTGDFRWQIVHGDTPDSIRNNPAIRGLNIPKTGQSGNVGVLVTKNLLVVGDSEYSTVPGRPRGAMLHAYDKMTGRELGTVYMPAPQTGSPMTYSYDGKQYIIVAVGGGSYSGDYIAYTLPSGN